MTAALIDLSDDEIRRRLRQDAENVQWAVNDYLRELDRRAAERHASEIRALTRTLVGASITYTLVTLALVVVTAMKP